MLARKEDGGKVSLKMGFLIPKTLRMKILELRLFSKPELEKYLQNGGGENYFQKLRKMMKWQRDTWPKGGHAKVTKR